MGLRLPARREVVLHCTRYPAQVGCARQNRYRRTAAAQSADQKGMWDCREIQNQTRPNGLNSAGTRRYPNTRIQSRNRLEDSPGVILQTGAAAGLTGYVVKFRACDTAVRVSANVT